MRKCWQTYLLDNDQPTYLIRVLINGSLDNDQPTYLIRMFINSSLANNQPTYRIRIFINGSLGNDQPTYRIRMFINGSLESDQPPELTVFELTLRSAVDLPFSQKVFLIGKSVYESTLSVEKMNVRNPLQRLSYAFCFFYGSVHKSFSLTTHFQFSTMT